MYFRMGLNVTVSSCAKWLHQDRAFEIFFFFLNTASHCVSLAGLKLHT